LREKRWQVRKDIKEGRKEGRQGRKGIKVGRS
jgi:hypothetical protein